MTYKEKLIESQRKLNSTRIALLKIISILEKIENKGGEDGKLAKEAIKILTNKKL